MGKELTSAKSRQMAAVVDKTNKSETDVLEGAILGGSGAFIVLIRLIQGECPLSLIFSRWPG